MSRERPFEPVHTTVDWYDGPREGIADFDGEPHVYQSRWDEELQDFDPAYVLTPIPDDVFQLAMEDWRIWLRWEAVNHEGRTSDGTHPALPEDREHHDAITQILEARLVEDPTTSFRAVGEFKRTSDAEK